MLRYTYIVCRVRITVTNLLEKRSVAELSGYRHVRLNSWRIMDYNTVKTGMFRTNIVLPSKRYHSPNTKASITNFTIRHSK